MILLPVACLLVAALFILRSRVAIPPWNDRLRLLGVGFLGAGLALMALRIAFIITG